MWQAVCQVLKDHCIFSTMSPNTFTSLPTETCACLVTSNSLQPHRLSPQASLFMGFSRQEYWSGLPFPTQEDLPDPGMEPAPVSGIGQRSHLGNPLPTKTMRKTPCFLNLQFFETLWTIACQASLFMGFSRQQNWSGLPCPPPGDLPDAGI